MLQQNDEKHSNDNKSNEIEVVDDKHGFEMVTKKKKSNKRTITILGDSMVKELNPWLMQKKMDNETDKIYRHSFSGAKVDQMYHYANAIMPFNPDLVILHAGTNNLRENSTPQNIANDIVKLASSLKTDENEIIVSSILARRDNLHDKAEKVNDFLKIKCDQINIPFIRHNNIKCDTHLKPKGVHLNRVGTTILANNFVNWINK